MHHFTAFNNRNLCEAEEILDLEKLNGGVSW